MRLNHVASILAVTAAAACGELPPDPAPPEGQAAFAATAAAAVPQVVDITARGHVELELSHRTVPPGWTTFRLRNASHVVHFAVFEKFPAGKGIEDYRAEIAPVFQNLMDLLGGKVLSFPAAGTDLPAWFADVQFTGGPGLLAPGGAGAVTLELEPGTYVIECYVKTADGVFHSVLGMATELVVTGEASRAREPDATLRVSVSSGGGIHAPATVRPGRHTVAVDFLDQTAYSHFLGHDVHLVRVDAGTDLDAVGAWMDWTQPGGLAEPAPATFLGGIQDMPAGSTGYLDVLLRPGSYAWISEVPDPAGKAMVRAFTVAAAAGSH